MEVKGIPEYINMLEDAQRQAGRAGHTISYETLLLFASTAMLTSERFLRANDDWEDRAKLDNTWAAWKLAYKQAHAKARVKAQAHEGSTKFGAANSPPAHNTSSLLTISMREAAETSKHYMVISTTSPQPRLTRKTC